MSVVDEKSQHDVHTSIVELVRERIKRNSEDTHKLCLGEGLRAIHHQFYMSPIHIYRFPVGGLPGGRNGKIDASTTRTVKQG